MNDREAPRLLTFQNSGRGWLQRALLGVLGLGVFVVAFFFLTVALIAGALLAAAIAVRWWWMLRRIRAAQQASAPLEGQYSVVDRVDADQRRVH